MEAETHWGYGWYEMFHQTQSEIERDAIYALVLKSDDLEQIRVLSLMPAVEPPSTTGVLNPYTYNDVGSSTRYVGRYYNRSMRLINQLKTLEANSQDSSSEYMQCLKDLLSLHTSCNNYPEANNFVQKTVKARENKYGISHPFTVILLEHIAIWYRQQRKFEEAGRVQQRLSEAYKQKAIADEVWYRSPLEQLAYFCYADGEYAQAEPLYQEVLKRIEASSAHISIKRPEMLRVLNKLGSLYTGWKRYDKAEETYQRLLIMHKGNATHEQNPVLLPGILEVLKQQEKYQAPEVYGERLWELHQTALGAEHPHTLYTLYTLAETYRTQLDHKRAEATFLQLLASQEKVLGAAHLKCIRTLDGLKTVYTRLNDLPKLESVYLRLIERRRQTLGKSHPDTGQNINNLASLYAHQGRDKEAAHWYAELVMVYEDSSETAKLKAARNNLDRLSRKLNPPAPTKKTPVGSGYAIPAPPQMPAPKAFALDIESVKQKIVETAQVQELLQAQFVEDEVTPAVVSVTTAPADTSEDAPDTSPFKSLDTPHFALLNWLLKKPFWKMQDIEAVAKPLGLMANGALERLNDMALEMGEDNIFEGEDPIEVNIPLIRELLL